MPAVIWQQPNRAPAGNVRVLHVTAEVYPQVKTGGLGDIAAALPTALLAQGVDARLLVPGYPAIIDNLEEVGLVADLGAMARIWRGGGIIRARFLDAITRAYAENPSLASLLTAPVFASSLATVLPAWRQVVATSATTGVPAPAFASSLAYVDQLRSRRLPAALIQGQRDFFGSHTYHRTDDVEGVYHTLWATPERTEEKWD